LFIGFVINPARGGKFIFLYYLFKEKGMKKKFKLLGVWIAVLTAIVFVLSGCDQLVDSLSPTDDEDTVTFVAVTDITGLPTGEVVDAAIDLSAGVTAGTVSGTSVTPTEEGTLTLTATIANGAAAGSPFTRTFTIEVVNEDDFMAVTNITGVPTTGTAGRLLT
jgi:hypothetical protein